uniref:Uncharacterized protein n=1 Tax=Hyaloperonospora arabidopsidis (strain Emoy2) TaxID=559515 RepID=M4C634_HYAAE
MAEVKQTASFRLQLQVENDIKAKDVVAPSQTPVGAAAVDHNKVLPVAATPPINAGNLVAPAPKKQWMTVPIRHAERVVLIPSTTLGGHQLRRIASSTWPSSLTMKTTKVLSWRQCPLSTGAMTWLRGGEQVASPPIAITDAARANLLLLTAKPKKLRSIPQLVSL